MAAHELTFHLWKAGFNRNLLEEKKYAFSSSAVMHTPGSWGVLLGDTCQSKQVKLLHMQQLVQDSSLWGLCYQGLSNLIELT